MSTGTSTEDVVRRYFATVADLGSTREDLEPLLDDDLVVVEHPNAVTPVRTARGKEETLAGFAAGKGLLRRQGFDVHEVVVDGERAAVRATWEGEIGVAAGPFTEGDVLRSAVAAFLTVRGGRVVEHETFDCYDPRV